MPIFTDSKKKFIETFGLKLFINKLDTRHKVKNVRNLKNQGEKPAEQNNRNNDGKNTLGYCTRQWNGNFPGEQIHHKIN